MEEQTIHKFKYKNSNKVKKPSLDILPFELSKVNEETGPFLVLKMTTNNKLLKK